ncbi:MAG: hypothetical protein OEW16_07395 [Gammaproteobacteria bacterium]|nr:hypothetical protein [Gammaproteobacteria bacterium]
MTARRVQITFTAKVPNEDRELFAQVLEMWGTVYRSHKDAGLTVLSTADKEAELKAQLTEWANEGALSWSDAN